MAYEIERYKPKEKTEFTTKEVATRLEISTDSLHKLRKQHRMEEQGLVRVETLSTEKGTQKGYLWTPEAIKFAIKKLPSVQKEWKDSIKDEFIEKGYVISEGLLPKDPFDLFIQQAEMLKESFLQLKRQDEKIHLLESNIEGVNTEVKQFKQKYEEEKPIRTETVKIITDAVHKCVINSGLSYNYYYSRIWNHFGIRSTAKTTEIVGQKVVKFIRTDPIFRKFSGINE